MVARIIELSAKFRGFVLLIYVVLIGLAFGAVKGMQLDAIRISRIAGHHFHRVEGQSPTLIEDQVASVAASYWRAAVNAVRGYSMFGMSFICVLSTRAPTCTGPAAGCSST
jgi:Cu/Ag efflux pump CusA